MIYFSDACALADTDNCMERDGIIDVDAAIVTDVGADHNEVCVVDDETDVLIFSDFQLRNLLHH